jgi:hypothetical protein
VSQAAPPSPVLFRGHETPLIFTDGGQVFTDSGQVLSLTECAAATQRTGELINPDVLCRWLIWWDLQESSFTQACHHPFGSSQHIPYWYTGLICYPWPSHENRLAATRVG